jgi:hypothetical protein
MVQMFVLVAHIMNEYRKRKSRCGVRYAAQQIPKFVGLAIAAVVLLQSRGSSGIFANGQATTSQLRQEVCAAHHPS